MAEQYLDAHKKKLSTKALLERCDFKDTKLAESRGQKYIMSCFTCNGKGHRAVVFHSKAPTSQMN